MNYNEQTATTTELCLDPGTNYCLEWQKTEIKTFNWADTLALFLIPISIYWVIKLFKK